MKNLLFLVLILCYTVAAQQVFPSPDSPGIMMNLPTKNGFLHGEFIADGNDKSITGSFYKNNHSGKWQFVNKKSNVTIDVGFYNNRSLYSLNVIRDSDTLNVKPSKIFDVAKNTEGYIPYAKVEDNEVLISMTNYHYLASTEANEAFF